MAQRDVHLLLSRFKKHNQNFKYRIETLARSQGLRCLHVTLHLKCRVDTPGKEGNPGHGHSHHSQKSQTGVLSVHPGMWLVHAESSLPLDKDTFSVQVTLRAFSKIFSALFQESWYDLSTSLSILISYTAGSMAHWLGEWTLD